MQHKEIKDTEYKHKLIITFPNTTLEPEQNSVFISLLFNLPLIFSLTTFWPQGVIAMATKPHGSVSQSSLCQSHSQQEIITTDRRAVSQDTLHFPAIILKDTKESITLQSRTLPSEYLNKWQIIQGQIWQGPKPLGHRTSSKTFTLLQK